MPNVMIVLVRSASNLGEGFLKDDPLELCFCISQDDPLLSWENSGRLKLEFGQYDQSHLYNAERIVVSPGVPIKSNNLEDLIHKVVILIRKITKILVERIIKFLYK
jgi:UDP-N-acetylmuramoylalanine-D-glutamate ligase